jgi:hypothetical protein
LGRLGSKSCCRAKKRSLPNVNEHFSGKADAKRALLGKFSLFLEDKEYSQYKTYKARKVIPAQWLALHKYSYEECKDKQRYNLLNNFEFPDIKRTSEGNTSETVGRHLQAILKEGDQPTKNHNGIDTKSLQARFEHYLTIPRQGHKGIRAYKQ